VWRQLQGGSSLSSPASAAGHRRSTPAAATAAAKSNYELFVAGTRRPLQYLLIG